MRSEEHTSELQSRPHLVCRLLLEKKKKKKKKKQDMTRSHCDTSPLVLLLLLLFFFFFFFNDTATTEIYTLSLHDALPILKADVKCALRKGAWYRILKLTSTEVVLDVRGKPLSVPRGQLQDEIGRAHV